MFNHGLYTNEAVKERRLLRKSTIPQSAQRGIEDRWKFLPIRVMNASQELRPKAKPPPRPTSWRLQSQRRLPEGPRCTPSPWVTVEDGRERLRGANLINLTHPTSID